MRGRAGWLEGSRGDRRVGQGVAAGRLGGACVGAAGRVDFFLFLYEANGRVAEYALVVSCPSCSPSACSPQLPLPTSHHPPSLRSCDWQSQVCPLFPSRCSPARYHGWTTLPHIAQRNRHCRWRLQRRGVGKAAGYHLCAAGCLMLRCGGGERAEGGGRPRLVGGGGGGRRRRGGMRMGAGGPLLGTHPPGTIGHTPPHPP